MFDALRDIGLVTNDDAMFYTASILLALEHLNEINVIHRDLKPENCMIDCDGYIKLIDFGTAKVVTGRTYTMIGTPHYIAPEVILGRGYDISADLWSLGIMLFEFISGGVPFAEGIDEPYQIYERILKGFIQYPNTIGGKHPARGIIEIMINRNPAIRGTPTSLMKNRWFANFSWDALIDRSIIPSYIPPVSSQLEKPQKYSLQQILAIEDKKSFEPTNKTSPAGWDEKF